MNGNSFGKWCGISGFGESHGSAIGVLLQDIKPGVEFPLEAIEAELARRRPGNKPFGTSRSEPDAIEILSGVLDGLTTGMPICLIVRNKDNRSQDYRDLEDIFRPGHADYSWYSKFKIFDWRGGGRASGRETIARVAAGAVVNQMIYPVKIQAYPVQIGRVAASQKDQGSANPLFWPDKSTYEAVLEELAQASESKDSLGGIIELSIDQVPAGLGDPVFARLDARLSEALMSIGGIKGIEFGHGFRLAGLRGSQSNDQMNKNGFMSNNCGGILGGVSTGEEILIRLAVKPVSSHGKKQLTIDKKGSEREIELGGRHDMTLMVRIIPVIEAMAKLAIADCKSFQQQIRGEKKGLSDYREAIDRIDEDILLGLKRRQMVIKQVAEFKRKENLAIKDNFREKKMMEKLIDKARAWDVEVELVQKIWEEILEQSRKSQQEDFS